MSTRLKIYPNYGIGMFHVGESLTQCVKKLQSFGNDIEFRYSNLNLIVVCNKAMGVILNFDSFSQKLIFIQLAVKTEGINYIYQNNTITNFTFKNVYNRFFGPTFEGDYDKTENKYYLSYCGISFIFKDVDSSTNTNKKLSTCDNDVNCSTIMIYRSDKNVNWLCHSKKICESLNKTPDLLYMKNLDELIYTSEEKPSIWLVKMNLNDNSKLSFDIIKNGVHNPYQLDIGITSMHSVINQFGFPDNTICKRKKRTNLMKLKKIECVNKTFSFESTKSYMPISVIDKFPNIQKLISPNGMLTDLNCDQEMIIIHNYFDLGLDVVYDLDASMNGSGIVSRVILHQNSIESLEFLRYTKIPVIYMNSDRNTNGLNLKTLSEVGKAIKLTFLPVFLDRKEYHVEESVDANEDFEIIDSIAPDNTSEDEKLKYWGLSRYDGCQFAIWEALIRDDEISCITVLDSN